MKKEIPEDIQAALTRRWVSVGALAQELCRRRIVSNTKAGYRFLRCAVIEAGGQRISAGRKSWITLSDNPAPTAELRALEEWASVPTRMAKEPLNTAHIGFKGLYPRRASRRLLTKGMKRRSAHLKSCAGKQLNLFLSTRQPWSGKSN